MIGQQISPPRFSKFRFRESIFSKRKLPSAQICRIMMLFAKAKSPKANKLAGHHSSHPVKLYAVLETVRPSQQTRTPPPAVIGLTVSARRRAAVLGLDEETAAFGRTKKETERQERWQHRYCNRCGRNL
jgi:hypothetical protein